jgi:Uma2 family endonuclease
MSSALETNQSTVPHEDEVLYEVVNGQHVELPPMSAESSLIAAIIHGELYPFVKQHQLGRVVPETLFIMNGEKEKRRPDVAFISKERWPLDKKVPSVGDWGVVPDLAIEVASPHDSLYHVLTKVGEYFDYGVKLVWVVVPVDKSIYVYESLDRVKRLSVKDQLQAPEMLPGWSYPVEKLFDV